MSFRFSCPKCASYHVVLHSDRQATYRDQPTHFLKCTLCAWVLYGDGNIQREVGRQQSSWRREREEFERQRQVAQVAHAEAERRLEEAETRRISMTCHWPTCPNQRRHNSKYCSRDCSNRNARARYKRRGVKSKEDGKIEAA